MSSGPGAGGNGKFSAVCDLTGNDTQLFGIEELPNDPHQVFGHPVRAECLTKALTRSTETKALTTMAHGTNPRCVPHAGGFDH